MLNTDNALWYQNIKRFEITRNENVYNTGKQKLAKEEQTGNKKKNYRYYNKTRENPTGSSKHHGPLAEVATSGSKYDDHY